MKNYLSYTLALIVVVLVGLLLMNHVPSISIFNKQMRKVDLLGDIRKEKVVIDSTSFLDTIPMPSVAKPAFVDSCKKGMICIEDYSDSTQRGMSLFYEALSQKIENKEPVRIAVFGDSFIEADIFTADLRELLQNKYGGKGVGFVPITSLVYGFRPTVYHRFDGWDTHTVTDSVYFDYSKQGVSGHYYRPTYEGAYVELRGQRKYASNLEVVDLSTIYFKNNDSLTLSVKVNHNEPIFHDIPASKKLDKLTIEDNIERVRWTVESCDSTYFYGIAMDGASGIILDNFSLRGSSGTSLRSIPAEMLKEFNALRPYDLVILQYGLNVASEHNLDYDYYYKMMLPNVEHIKKCFPEAGLLLVSVGDRDYKTETGDVKTMPGVKSLVRYQQKIAAKSNIAFWNLFEAMGGDESMASLVHDNPSKANYDYTHINFRGGKHLAEILYETLIYGKEQYDKRKAYEKE
ncbi:MAG: SGNH/GDSL hydrolase family protein [Bacteroides sp.]|nr:SGNH/GDSL hydrolase family protein [Bacteroides sp.]MDD2644727.1 SGNH/GDSL hydrolase family protein [Bacteroides sp.]MDD4054844.1 SGNH/GDSL hydrolase family protein [Bacteroides sp.]MDD4720426.1 SGNH/GDSL hydrolase family protein [Bacteroides sp.]NLI64343.1 hypothetical protein [Bacteroidales bacterium]